MSVAEITEIQRRYASSGRLLEVRGLETSFHTRDGVVRLLVREQLPAVLTGLAAGAIASLWTVALVRSYLYELTTGDVRVWAAAIAIVLATAVAGAMLPALRASRIDPIRSLRID